MSMNPPKRNRNSDSKNDDPGSTVVVEHVDKMLATAGIEKTQTKSEWCLRLGLQHIMSAESTVPLMDFIIANGPPTLYESISCRHNDSALENLKKPANCFESLCRIVAGQQLAGTAAQSVWKRLLETVNQDLTPETILSLANENIEICLQKPAGLSGAKARSMVDLSQHFMDRTLSDQLLTSSTDEEVCALLLNVKGIGPWSCDMFLMFYLERGDIFPVGDLGIRKGLARHFQVSGKGTSGALCQKKDLDRMLEIAAPYRPYRSLLAYYMWKAADSKDFYKDTIKVGKKARKT